MIEKEQKMDKNGANIKVQCERLRPELSDNLEW